MINRLTEKLDNSGIEDYEVSSIIPRDVISVEQCYNDTRVYIPVDLEFSQYGIDDKIRELSRFMRTTITQDRNILILKTGSCLNESQFYKLIEYIIEEEGFCTIINK